MLVYWSVMLIYCGSSTLKHGENLGHIVGIRNPTDASYHEALEGLVTRICKDHHGSAIYLSHGNWSSAIWKGNKTQFVTGQKLSIVANYLNYVLT